MDEWLTRASIWLAMGAWTLAVALRGRPRFARGAWAFGLAAYLAHIVLAYAAFYEWSHRVAWERTALDTEAVTGWRSGAGLVVNYLFALALAADLARQFLGRRSSVWTGALVAFMVLNGAVVFGEGAVRWYGAALLLAMLAGLAKRGAPPPRSATEGEDEVEG